MRQVVIYPGEIGYFVAECPSLPGCISQGKTKEEAIQNIKEAIELYVAVLKDDGLPVPEENFDVLTIVV
ncbi:type II toxin-antitoxin system HicB family antitoxin [bacterium]|nr:type II toxin-antitoxin system HicB family antitoxin [bacterium]